MIQQIRDNVIVSITPVAEPDGRDRYVDWYYRYLVDMTDERENRRGSRPTGASTSSTTTTGTSITPR